MDQRERLTRQIFDTMVAICFVESQGEHGQTSNVPAQAYDQQRHDFERFMANRHGTEWQALTADDSEDQLDNMLAEWQSRAQALGIKGMPPQAKASGHQQDVANEAGLSRNQEASGVAALRTELFSAATPQPHPERPHERQPRR